MAMGEDRLRFYPVEIGYDLVRMNMFEFVFPDSSMIPGSSDILRIMCKSFTVQLPTTNTVQVNWISGVGQYAGRQSTPYSLQVTFLVGNETQNDGMKGLYIWRNLVMDHHTGHVRVASNYKKNCYVNIYDVAGENLKYKIEAFGLWPTNMGDIQLNVEQDGVMELNCTFAADRMEMTEINGSSSTSIASTASSVANATTSVTVDRTTDTLR